MPALVPKLVEMIPCDEFLCPKDGRLPFGVLISAYSHDERTFSRLLKEAHNAGRMTKAHTLAAPDAICQALSHTACRSVPTALITHRHDLAEGDAFDLVVSVRPDMHVAGALREKGYSPQWFTRLYYYASTPFNVTLALDSNVAVCGSVWPLLQAAQMWDFAVPNQIRDCEAFWPHNFMLAYSWTGRTRLLFERWLIRQLQIGIPVDDQQTLMYALHDVRKRVRLRAGQLLVNGGMSLLTLDTKYFRRYLPAVTKIIQGSAIVTHPYPFAGTTCTDWNAGAEAGLPRLLVAFNDPASRNVSLKLARSATRCQALAREPCRPIDGCDKKMKWLKGVHNRLWPGTRDGRSRASDALRSEMLIGKMN
jgi:hypothetical protein